MLLIVNVEVLSYDCFCLWLAAFFYSWHQISERVPKTIGHPHIIRSTSPLRKFNHGPSNFITRKHLSSHRFAIFNPLLEVFVALVHELPDESMGSKSFKSNHIRLLVLNGMLNIVSDQPKVLPLFEIVFGFLLIFKIDFLFSLSCLLNSLVVDLV